MMWDERKRAARGARRRLRALAAIGWSCEALAEHTILTVEELDEARSREVTLQPWVIREIRELYEALFMRPAPASTAEDRTRRARALQIARHRGWPAPLRWDDIDRDRVASPAHETGPRSTDWVAVRFACAGQIPWQDLAQPERRAAYERLAGQGLTIAEIARQLGASDWAVAAYARPRRKGAAA